MSLGFFALHPVTLPIGNELINAVATTMNYVVLMYGTVIKPTMMELLEVVKLTS